MRTWKMLLICGVIVATILLCLLTAVSQSQPDKDLSADFDDLELPRKKASPKFRVRVMGIEDDIQSEAQSYIKRELRSLGDVEIVYKDAEWRLRILGGEIRPEGGRKKIGNMLSVVVVSRVLCNFGPVYQYRQNYLYSDGPDDLDKMCKKMVTAFDIDFLEPERKKR